jgi:hypothetical protein
LTKLALPTLSVLIAQTAVNVAKTYSVAEVVGEPHDDLEPAIFLLLVYGWFTEGFDTLDLKQAKALLDEL